MRYLIPCLAVFLFLSCHKQIGGPRKITAIGHIEYSYFTNLVTTVFYDEPNDARRFTMRINRDYTISGDVTGTWAPNGAKIHLNVDGDFGPNSPFPPEYGYYETKDEIVVEGHVVDMRQFAEDTYFIAYTSGNLGGKEYIRQFVFE